MGANPFEMIMGFQEQVLHEQRLDNESMDKEDLHQDIREMAQRMLGADPERQGNVMDTLADYLVRECGCDGPQALIAQLTKLDDIGKSQWPSYDLSSRAYMAVNMIRFEKAKGVLSGG